MITLLTGENSFEVQRALVEITAPFAGAVEQVDGIELEQRQLPDLLMGTSLLSDKRVVVIRDLSLNKAIWEALPDWLSRKSDDIDLVLIEPKLDKRTKTYKFLQKNASVHDYQPWSQRDRGKAEAWLAAQAMVCGMTLTPAVVRLLVARVGTDQWQLAQALDKLAIFEVVDEELVCRVIEARPSESVFELFETALKGDATRLRELIDVLGATEDPYMVFGLLSGQALQLAALALAREGDNPARDLGVHPYTLSRLRSHAERMGPRGARRIIAVFAAADSAMKTSSFDPWAAVEHALFSVAAQ